MPHTNCYITPRKGINMNRSGPRTGATKTLKGRGAQVTTTMRVLRPLYEAAMRIAIAEGKSLGRVFNELAEMGLTQRRGLLRDAVPEPDPVDDKFVLAEESE